MFRSFRPSMSPTIVTVSAGSSETLDRKSTRLNSSHVEISYAVFCLKKKKKNKKLYHNVINSSHIYHIHPPRYIYFSLFKFTNLYLLSIACKNSSRRLLHTLTIVYYV